MKTGRSRRGSLGVGRCRMVARAAMVGVALMLGAAAPAARAQQDIPSKVPISWNRYYTYAEMEQQVKAIAAAYPNIVRLENIGKSGQGRDLWVAIVNNPATGPDTSKPAMWIDGNVHGNEIQAGEAVVYSLWYLTKAFGNNEQITKTLDNVAFYLCPSQNPDGREYWFSGPNNPSSSRSNQRPVDDDEDGVADEDPPDDLDGDGSITSMWKEDHVEGDWTRSKTDPRVFIRVKPGEKGEWRRVGSEGIDNDGDGLINEDGPGGDDMNRNWPSDWQPDYVQNGAGEFPFSNPEPRAIGAFILGHPNIAGVQSYHNAGGMILRGPGASYRENTYPFDDRAAYDEIQRVGEQMLPYYKAMVIYRDLYTVHGGFVNWTAEGLGIFSFTNEMWNDNKYFYREGGDETERDWIWRDRINFGQVFKDYTEYEHPKWGKVLIGGPNKWASRVTPTFMLEEELHRNFAFTKYHADQMPLIKVDRVATERVAGTADVWMLTIEIKNENLIPSRSGIARNNRIGHADIMTCRGAGEPEGQASSRVLAAGTLSDWNDKQPGLVRFEPWRLQMHSGVPSKGRVIVRYYVKGNVGDEFVVRYQGQKIKTLDTSVKLAEPAK
ncbi:MAG: M14 family metallopeptidase [Phycisphaerales bacterium]